MTFYGELGVYLAPGSGAVLMQLLALLTTPLFVAAGLPVSAGDLLGFVTGLLCVWLAARGQVWNFPVGILNSAVLGLVFFQQRLFADATLQLVFIALAVQGWRHWQRGGLTRSSAPVAGTSMREQLALLGVAAFITLVLWQLLVWLKGAVPPVDALVTALSLCAQWQLNRRQWSCWPWWITVDLISVPLYWSRDLPLIAGLYVIFLLLCVQGWRQWRALVEGQTAGVAR
jgi:nicotinamide mononucleotide transporter